ncbi:Glyoxalase/bleomycin resistance protein/dioxygenase [Trichormus variabilis ATCC 29413]|uniref:Glyoxalase/bleomycin resistance protein/dioxygenase n=2 Tax=Anabaena variabilis TaxID=264691 RepID=Q3M8F9_TRIV2|nr:Glyoxalase/bleomycin resistance protein/dioxygenase [Trichormus variabilis ATCC 29413]QFZ12752.1 glyoxalase [Anabaena sp. YBS01]QHD82158.1 glyoxalase [Trichormus variabilis 0441]
MKSHYLRWTERHRSLPIMQITQGLHTAILVTDLERSEQFYSQVLGLSKIDRLLKYTGIWYQVGNYQIHLIVASDVPTDNPNEKWGRNPHIAFSVTDLEAAKQELINKNYPIQPSASGRPALFTQDPDGNIIELSQQ